MINISEAIDKLQLFKQEKQHEISKLEDHLSSFKHNANKIYNSESVLIEKEILEKYSLTMKEFNFLFNNGFNYNTFIVTPYFNERNSEDGYKLQCSYCGASKWHYIKLIPQSVKNIYKIELTEKYKLSLDIDGKFLDISDLEGESIKGNYKDCVGKIVNGEFKIYE